MQNLNPTRNIVRRGRDFMIIGALLMMGGLVAFGIGVFLGLLLSNNIVAYGVLGLGAIILLAGIGTFIRGMTLRRENEPALAVSEVLSRELGADFVMLRNLSRRGLGYIDALLLGPPGALVFRLVDLPGLFTNEGADWLERKGGSMSLSRLNATRECVTDVYALRQYLTKRGLANVPVYAMVVFTNPNATISARQPTVPVAQLTTLPTALRRDFLTTDRISRAEVDQMVQILYN